MLRRASGNKLIFYKNQEFFIYNTNTNQISKIECEEEGTDLYSITSDKIFFNVGSGLFGYTDFDGNYVSLIGMDANNFSDYSGIYTWDIQYTPTNGKPVSDDGTKLLVKEMWQDYDNPNYYILQLSESSSSSNSDNTNDDDGSGDADSSSVTLIHSIQMFDFSTGQYVFEPFTTEDIDVLTITDNGDVRLYAQNDAEIKKQGDAEYLSYIDVSVGAICLLKDNEGGIATFTVTSIGTSTEGYPGATITWSYS